MDKKLESDIQGQTKKNINSMYIGAYTSTLVFHLPIQAAMTRKATTAITFATHIQTSVALGIHFTAPLLVPGQQLDISNTHSAFLRKLKHDELNNYCYVSLTMVM